MPATVVRNMPASARRVRRTIGIDAMLTSFAAQAAMFVLKPMSSIRRGVSGHIGQEGDLGIGQVASVAEDE